MSPFRTVLNGFGWGSSLRFTGALLAALKIAILARILTPTDFGIFSLILVGLGLSEAATETGINTTLLQTKRKLSEFTNTAWSIAILRGVLIGLLMLAVGALLQEWYGEPGLFRLMIWAAVVPIIKSFIHPGLIHYKKELDFKHDTLYRGSVLLVEVFATVGLVLVWPTVTSLIGGLLVSSVYEVGLSYGLLRGIPRWQIVRQRAEEIFANAASLLPSSLLSYLAENSDNVVFGKLTSTATLGLYQNAYLLSHKPNSELGKLLGSSSLAVYTSLINSRKSESHPSTWNLYRQTIVKGVGLFTVLSLPLFLFPELLVKIILGSQWLSIVPALPALGVAGILQTISHLTHPILIAEKKYRGVLIEQLISLSVMLTGMVILVPSHGILGAAVSLCIARFVGAGILYVFVRKEYA